MQARLVAYTHRRLAVSPVFLDCRSGSLQVKLEGVVPVSIRSSPTNRRSLNSSSELGMTLLKKCCKRQAATNLHGSRQPPLMRSGLPVARALWATSLDIPIQGMDWPWLGRFFRVASRTEENSLRKHQPSSSLRRFWVGSVAPLKRRHLICRSGNSLGQCYQYPEATRSYRPRKLLESCPAPLVPREVVVHPRRCFR
jgi:hypothetical protein